MDMTSISAALAGIKTATEIAKLIKDSDVSLEKAESKLKLAELISALADTKIEIAEIQQMLLEKEAEIRKIVAQLDIRQNLIWEKPYYFVLDEDGKQDGPYCQPCYDKSHVLIRLQGGDAGIWACKVCKCTFIDKNHVEPAFQREHNPFD